MHPIAVITPEQHGRLLSQLRREVAPTLATYADAIRRLDETVVPMLIVDPEVLRADAFLRLIERGAAQGSSVLVYGRLSAAMCQAVCIAATHLPVEVVIATGEEGTAMLRRSLSRTSFESSVEALCLRTVAHHVMRVPSELRIPVVGLFGGSRLPLSAADFCEKARLSPGTAAAWLKRERLAPVVHFLTGMRLCQSWPDLEGHELSLEEIAARHDFGDVRSLSAAYHRVTGFPPRRAARHFSRLEVARRIASHLVLAE
jgi:AraC-like DNA-binding protein